MKKIILFASILIAGTAVKAQTAATPAQPTQITPAATIEQVLKFQEADHEMGKIPYGKPVEYDVTITNISKDSVKIQNVQAGCGCTTPKWKAGPYAPGETFKITVGFNGYTEGHFNKNVTIYFAGGLTKFLTFHGETFKPAATTPTTK
ncbi:DUF1573 domain-containing protein [Deminuibacter soli]|nr:DUF1573 domain-containing protein [Deminuibacter soli]